MRNEEFIKEQESIKSLALSTLDARYATKSDLNNINLSLRGPEGAKGDKGDKGETGEQGVQGDPGAKWYSGNGTPSVSLGIIGDFYIDLITKEVYEKTDTSTWTYKLNLCGDGVYSGRYEDVGITNNVATDGTITIADGDYNLYTNNGFIGFPVRYTITETILAMTDNSVNYVVADYNSGSPILDVTLNVEDINLADIIPVFTIIRTGTYIHVLDWDNMAIGFSEKLLNRIVKTWRFARESGLGISETGTRNISIENGKVWYGVTRQNLEAFVSGAVDSVTFLFYHDSNGDWIYSVVTQYDNTQYDSGTGLVELTAQRYGVNWVYRGVENQKHLYIILGTEDYLINEALESQPQLPPTLVSTQAILVGKIVVQKNASTAYDISSAFEVSFGTSGGVGDVTLAGNNVFTGSNTFTTTTTIQDIRAYSSVFRILNNNILNNNGMEFGFFTTAGSYMRPADRGGGEFMWISGSAGDDGTDGVLYLRGGYSSTPDAGAYLTLFGSTRTGFEGDISMASGYGGRLSILGYNADQINNSSLVMEGGYVDVTGLGFRYGGYSVLTINNTTDDLPEGAVNKYLTGNEAIINQTNIFTASQVINANLSTNTITVDEIYDRNGSGITVKELLILESQTNVTGNFYIDSLNEQTLDNGILIDLLRIKDGRGYINNTISEDTKLITFSEVDTKINNIYINIDGGSAASTYGGLPDPVDGGTA